MPRTSTIDHDLVLSAFEDSAVGTALVAADGSCLRVNRALARLLGTEREALVGAPCPLTHAAIGVPLDDRLTDPGGQPVEYERSVARPGAEPLWLLVSASVLPGHLVVHAHDITARKAAEAALRAREAELRAIFEDASVGLALTDGDGHFLHTNRAHAAMYGYEAGAVIGRHFTSVLSEHVRRSVSADNDALIAAGAASSQREVSIQRFDGSRGWALVDVGFVRDDAGHVRHTVAQVQDVTERRLAETALRESEERYRTLVEHLPMAVFSWTFDERDRVGYVSPRFEEMLGYPLEDWYAGPELLEAALHPDDRDATLARLRGAMAAREDVRCEYRMIARDGRTVTIRHEAAVVRDAGGRPLYALGFLQDISDRRRLEEQLRLAQKLESVGRLAAGIAHEINTPIQFVGDSVRFIHDACQDLLGLVAAHEALDAAGPAPELRDRLEAARDIADLAYVRERLPAAFERTSDGIRRVGEIVHAMRDFAHPDAGGSAPVDVNEAVRNTLVVTHSQYKLLADVETDLGELPPVPANGGEIKQVLVNVIVNAVHAIADRGDERGTIRVRTRHVGDEVAIAISDTGCGMPEETRERIFDPFFTTKGVGRGTGQGLAISHAIVHDRHGGSITVDSEVDSGTTIEIRLPVSR